MLNHKRTRIKCYFSLIKSIAVIYIKLFEWMWRKHEIDKKCKCNFPTEIDKHLWIKIRIQLLVWKLLTFPMPFDLCSLFCVEEYSKNVLMVLVCHEHSWNTLILHKRMFLILLNTPANNCEYIVVKLKFLTLFFFLFIHKQDCV